jgi:hypothetical protein
MRLSYPVWFRLGRLRQAWRRAEKGLQKDGYVEGNAVHVWLVGAEMLDTEMETSGLDANGQPYSGHWFGRDN